VKKPVKNRLFSFFFGRYGKFGKLFAIFATFFETKTQTNSISFIN